MPPSHVDASVWTVLRHSGRTSAPPAIRFTGPEERARRVYERINSTLRQGSVILIDHRGGIQQYHWAPKGLRE